ncbi:11651_t:CDS:1, partial [Racocetra persica]
MPPQPAFKQTRCHLSDRQKKEICEFAEKNQNLKHYNIASEFMKHYPDLKINCFIVSKILKKANEYKKLKD